MRKKMENNLLLRRKTVRRWSISRKIKEKKKLLSC